MRDRPGAWLVLAGLFAAPCAWSLQLLVSYGLNGDQCAADLARSSSWGERALIAVIGLIALALCAAGLVAAERVWRLTREEGPGGHHEGLTAGIGRTRFLGLAGLIGSSIFLVATAFALIIPFVVHPCPSPLF